MNETDAIKRDLLITLDVLRVSESPALIEDIVHFFINTTETAQVENNLIVSKLKELETDQKIFVSEDGFISFFNDIDGQVQKRLKTEESTRQKIKYAEKILNGLSKFDFIRFVGVMGDAPFGRIDTNVKIKLIIIADKETQHLASVVVKNYLRFKFALKKFEISTILESDNLRWPQNNPASGIMLLNLQPILNKDKTYENLMASNSWIFEIFSNYPLEKISWGFRVSKNDNRKVSEFNKRLNKFFSPKQS